MSNLLNDFAGGTDSMINGVGVLHIKRIAAAAGSQVQLVVHRNTVQQVPGPFEAKLWILVQQEVRLISTTESVSKLDVGPRPAWTNPIVVYADQEAGRKQRDQRGGLNLVPGVFHKSCDLSRRFAPAALDPGAVAVTKVG